MLELKSPSANVVGKWQKLSLDGVQQKEWMNRKTVMVWAVPSFADIWVSMMVDKDHEQAFFTDQIPTAATDDKLIFFNPKFYFGLTIDEATFVSCHEILHCMFNHAGIFYMLDKQGTVTYSDGVTLKWINEIGQQAADYVLNDQLIQAKIGKMPESGLHWPELITGGMSMLDAYRKLYELSEGGKQMQRIQPRTSDGKPCGAGGESKPGGKSFDKVIKPGQGRGKTPTEAMGERKEVEWDTTIQAAMEAAKLKGQLPASLERLFTKRLQPKADWRDLYLLAVSKRIGNDRYSWDRLEPQLAYRRIGAPGRTSYGCNAIVVAVDTSGSINQRTLDAFMTETVALLEQAKPKRIIFCQCDAEIQQWMEADSASDLYEIKLKGGGGTSFVPVFDRVEREGVEPDLLVYLTDLWGEFPRTKPNYPTIWGIVGDNPPTPPFGEVVNVPSQMESMDVG